MVEFTLKDIPVLRAAYYYLCIAVEHWDDYQLFHSSDYIRINLLGPLHCQLEFLECRYKLTHTPTLVQHVENYGQKSDEHLINDIYQQLQSYEQHTINIGEQKLSTIINQFIVLFKSCFPKYINDFNKVG